MSHIVIGAQVYTIEKENISVHKTEQCDTYLLWNHKALGLGN